MDEAEQMAMALWQLRFASNIEELVVNALVGAMTRRSRRNPTVRSEVVEVAKDLAAAVGEFDQPDDSFEEFREIFMAGYSRGHGRP
jgi:hypothetical protein